MGGFTQALKNSGIAKEEQARCPKCSTKLLSFGTNKMCPKCFYPEQNAVENLERQKAEFVQKESRISSANIAVNFFKSNSIFGNTKVSELDFQSYKAKTKEQQQAYDQVVKAGKKILSGEPVHLVLSGTTGAGKTHLATALANSILKKKQLDGYKVMFISWVKFFMQRRQAIQDKELSAELDKKINAIAKADLVVIDDLGAESETGKQASDFTQKDVFNIFEMLEDKNLILTTNAGTSGLTAMYGKRVLSRMLKHMDIVKMADFEDYRLKGE